MDDLVQFVRDEADMLDAPDAVRDHAVCRIADAVRGDVELLEAVLDALGRLSQEVIFPSDERRRDDAAYELVKDAIRSIEGAPG